MQLTSEHLDQYIGLLEEADKAFVGKIQRDPLAQAQADIFFQLGIRDKELMKWGLNQINIVKGAYQTSCSSIVNRFQTGKIGFEKAFNLWKDTTKVAMDGMYRAGAATVGNPFYKDLPIPGRDKRLMARYLNREGKFWKGLLWDIKDPKHTSIIPRDAAGKRMPGYRFKQFSYGDRAGMYPQSMEAMRYNGMIMGSGENVEIRWVKGSPQTESCVDCEALSTRMWTPYTLPTSPRAGGTKCKWKCYCHLEIKQKGRDPFFDMAGSATEGAMMAAGRYSQVFDTAGNAVGGQLQRDIGIWSAEMNRARQMMTITRGKDRMFWIGERKRFNRLIIDRTAAGQYKSVPTVSVSALRKTILAAQAKGGSLVDDFMTLGMGDEVWFVRSDYSSFGTIGIRNGVRVFKSPSGVVLNVDAATDVVFATQPKWKASGSLTHVEKWASKSIFKDTIFHGTTTANAENISKMGFDPGKILTATDAGIYGRGYYFSGKYDIAKMFARGWKVVTKKMGQVLEVRINVKRTFKSETKFYEIYRKHEKTMGYTEGYKSAIKIMDAVTDEIISLGYDSIFIQGEWVIFDPKNIMVIKGGDPTLNILR